MTTTARLQIANRIHLLLLKALGEGIEVQRMLASPLYARDVLLVCEGLKTDELVGLARQFRDASKPVAAAAPGREPRATPWADDTSGFGLSAPPADDKPNKDDNGWIGSTRRWFGI